MGCYLSAGQWGGSEKKRGQSLTVDGNSHGLGQDVAIGADEDGDLGEGVELQELGGRLGGVDDLGLNVETVGLRDSEDGRGAGVALWNSELEKLRVDLQDAKANSLQVLFLPP